MQIKGKTANNVFLQVLSILTDKSDGRVLHSSPRNLPIHEILNANLVIEDPTQFLTNRTYLSYAFAELIWYISGELNPERIIPYAKFWDSIRNYNETVNSNYGHYIFSSDYPSQYDECKKLLLEDNDTRKAVIQIFDPSTKLTQDTICTETIQFLLRDDELHCIVNMRSQDIITGFPYDVFFFCILQQMMRIELSISLDREIKLGYYHHNVGSLHLYEKNLNEIDEIQTKKLTKSIPEFTYQSLIEMLEMVDIEEEIRNKKFISSEVTSPFWLKAIEVLKKKFTPVPKHWTDEFEWINIEGW